MNGVFQAPINSRVAGASRCYWQQGVGAIGISMINICIEHLSFSDDSFVGKYSYLQRKPHCKLQLISHITSSHANMSLNTSPFFLFCISSLLQVRFIFSIAGFCSVGERDILVREMNRKLCQMGNPLQFFFDNGSNSKYNSFILVITSDILLITGCPFIHYTLFVLWHSDKS